MAFQDLFQKALQTAENPENTGFQIPDPSNGVKNGVLIAREAASLPQPKPQPNPMAALTKQVMPLLQQRVQKLGARMAPPPDPRLPASNGSGESTGMPDQTMTTGNRSTIPGGLPIDFVKNYLLEQNKGVDRQEALAEQYRNQPQKRDWSPILGLIDSFYGSKLTDNYQRPLSEQEKLAGYSTLTDKAQSQRQKLAGDLVQLTKSGETSEQKSIDNLWRIVGKNADRQTASGAKSAAALQKRAEDMQKMMDPTGARAGEFGKLYNRITKANAALALIKRRSDGNLTGPETRNFATSLASLIKGGGVINEGEVNDLIPSTAKGKFKDWVSFFNNDPEGREQQAFIKRMLQEVQAEHQNAREQAQQIINTRADDFADVREAMPSTWERHYSNGHKRLGDVPSSTLTGEEPIFKVKDKGAKSSGGNADHAVGTRMQGEGGKTFEFQGGDWNNQKNWTEVTPK